MMHDPIYTHWADYTEKLAPPQRMPSERLALVADAPTLSALSVSALAAHCMREISNYRNGEPSNELCGLELFRRAILQSNRDARLYLQQCFSEIVLSWLRRHPLREEAYAFDSEENYVARAFERFWMVTAHNQQFEFSSLATVLQYLRASLNGAILDTLRTCSRTKKAPMPEAGPREERRMEDSVDSGELLEHLREMFPGKREQRLIYLFFYCGLKPREIVRYCPHEFSDVREVYLIRRNIHERLLRNAGYIHWQPGTDNGSSIDNNIHEGIS
jgi:hypothetical protein